MKTTSAAGTSSMQPSYNVHASGSVAGAAMGTLALLAAAVNDTTLPRLHGEKSTVVGLPHLKEGGKSTDVGVTMSKASMLQAGKGGGGAEGGGGDGGGNGGGNMGGGGDSGKGATYTTTSASASTQLVAVRPHAVWCTVIQLPDVRPSQSST